jgi:hypothetical protein
VGTLLHATVYMLLHNLLNVLVQIANKMGLKKSVSRLSTQCEILYISQPYRPPRSVKGIALALTTLNAKLFRVSVYTEMESHQYSSTLFHCCHATIQY